jgi:NDP-sugar pyrophosphorylase family protein
VDALPPILILAGGLGTRIADLAGALPKSMVPVKGKPFVDLQLKLLASQGARRVVMCVGHQSQPLIDHVGTGSQFGLDVSYSPDGELLLGTGGAILKASNLVTSPFAVLYGDSYLDIDFKPAYQAFLQSGKRGLMIMFRNANSIIPSNILYEHGVVVAYNKDNPAPAMQHVDFGLSFFCKEAFQAEDGSTPFDLSQVVQSLIEQSELAGFETDQRFYEVGTPGGVRELEWYLSG